MDEHLPWWLLGLIDWPAYRLFGRCMVCGRLLVLHTPWALFVCERTPLPIEITEQGMARLAEYRLAESEPVVPVSMHAKSA
jgi:hypothetical protein